MFRTVRLSIIRSLFTAHSAKVYVIQVCRQLSSRTRMELHPWRVSWQNKFVKLVHLVGFITKKCEFICLILVWRMCTYIVYLKSLEAARRNITVSATKITALLRNMVPLSLGYKNVSSALVRFLWNVGKYVQRYMAYYLRRQSFSGTFPLATTFKLVLRLAQPLLGTRFLVDAADGKWIALLIRSNFHFSYTLSSEGKDIWRSNTSPCYISSA